MFLPFRWRPARRVHLGRSAARDHSHIRVRPNDCNRIYIRRIHRQHAIILQQHRTLFGDAPRRFKPAFHIHHALLHGMIYNAARKLRTQHSSRMVVQLCHRNFTVSHGLLQLVAIKFIFRLLVV